MFRRFSAPPLSSPNVPEARRAGRSFLSRSARPSIGKRAFSKPERLYFSGMAWAWGCGMSSIGLVATINSGSALGAVVTGAGVILCSAMAFDYRIALRDYFRGQVEHAISVQGDLHLDNAALRQELGFANRLLATYRGYIELLAAGQGGEAEGDEFGGESPSAGNVVPFRRMH
jgi:hypothetical protein